MADIQKKRITAVNFGLMTMLGLTAAAFGPAVRSFISNTGASEDAGTNLLLVKPIGFMISSYLTGLLLPRFNLRYSSLVLIPVWGVMFFTGIFADSYWLLAATLFLLAAAEGVFEVKSNMLLITLYREKSQPYLNALHFFFGLGALVSPALIGIGLDYYGSAVLPYGLIALLFVPLLIAVLSIRRFPDVAPPKEESAVPVKKVKPVAFAGIGLYMIGIVSAEFAFSMWIFRYAVEVYGFPQAQAGYINSAFFIAFTAGRLLATLYGAGNTIRIILGHMLLSFTALLIMYFMKEPQWLWAVSIISGLGYSVLFPCCFSILEQKVGLDSKLTSRLIIFTGIGSLIAPWGIGKLYQAYGAGAFIYAVSGALTASLTGILLFWAIYRTAAKVYKPG